MGQAFASRSLPGGIIVTKVPLSCKSSQLRSMAYRMPAPNSAPVAPQPALRLERHIDLLDVDAAVNRLDAGGEVEKLTRGGFGVGVGAGFGVFHGEPFLPHARQ